MPGCTTGSAEYLLDCCSNYYGGGGGEIPAGFPVSPRFVFFFLFGLAAGNEHSTDNIAAVVVAHSSLLRLQIPFTQSQPDNPLAIRVPSIPLSLVCIAPSSIPPFLQHITRLSTRELALVDWWFAPHRRVGLNAAEDPKSSLPPAVMAFK